MKKWLLITLALIFALPSAAALAEDGGRPVFTALSPNAMLMDMNTGRVLYEKGADEKIYPASTVKIMTALLALENLSLEDEITAGETAVAATPSV